MKTTRTAFVSDGNHRRFSLDPQTEAQIAYLVEWYREYVGERASGSAVVRRAVAELIARANTLTRAARSKAYSSELTAERVKMSETKKGGVAPWPAGALLEVAGSKPFPSPAELRERYARKTEKPDVWRALGVKKPSAAASEGAK